MLGSVNVFFDFAGACDYHYFAPEGAFCPHGEGPEPNNGNTP